MNLFNYKLAQFNLKYIPIFLYTNIYKYIIFYILNQVLYSQTYS